MDPKWIWIDHTAALTSRPPSPRHPSLSSIRTQTTPDHATGTPLLRYLALNYLGFTPDTTCERVGLPLLRSLILSLTDLRTLLKQVITKVKVATELGGTDCSFCVILEAPGGFFTDIRLNWSQDLSSGWETHVANSIGALSTLMTLSPHAYVHLRLQGIRP